MITLKLLPVEKHIHILVMNSNIGLKFEESLKREVSNNIDSYNLFKISVSEDKQFYKFESGTDEADFDVAIEKLISEDQASYRRGKTHFFLKNNKKWDLRKRLRNLSI